jgi:hypothetical protein
MAKLRVVKGNTIDPNQIPVRDELMVELICGATKSGIHVDRKKRANRDTCRKYDHRKYND